MRSTRSCSTWLLTRLGMPSTRWSHVAPCLNRTQLVSSKNLAPSSLACIRCCCCWSSVYWTKKAVAKHLASFMLHDLRRFAKFNSSTTRPYTISALFTYRVYEEQKYIRLRDDGKIEVDHDKAVDVLRRLSQAFENLLGAQDRMAGSDIEAVLTDMERETDLHRHLVDKLKETSD
eukprot:Rmarinus@m.13393